MATTSIRVPDELRARIARAAKQAGMKPHALMLEALEERVELEEARAAVISEADARYEDWKQSARGYEWHEMRSYLRASVAGRKARRPRAKTWPR
jgi:predicted transcriptional regulator